MLGLRFAGGGPIPACALDCRISAQEAAAQHDVVFCICMDVMHCYPVESMCVRAWLESLLPTRSSSSHQITVLVTGSHSPPIKIILAIDSSCSCIKMLSDSNSANQRAHQVHSFYASTSSSSSSHAPTIASVYTYCLPDLWGSAGRVPLTTPSGS